MHGVSSLSLPFVSFVKSDADIGHKSATKVANMACSFNLQYIPRPAEIDSQQLQQTRCEHNFFLTSSYQMQPAPSPTKRIGKQTNTSSTEQHCNSKLRTQMTPTKESGGRKFSSSSYVDVNLVRTNQQIPYKIGSLQGNGLGNEETLAFHKNFSPNPIAESECLQCLSMYNTSQTTPRGPVCNLSA